MDFDIELLREWILSSGLSLHQLVYVAIGAALVLFFSVRVLLTWYLGTQKILSEIRALRRQIFELQEALQGKTPAEETPEEKKKTDTFRLVH